MMIPCLCFLRMALTYIVPVRYCMNRGSANGAPAGGAFLVDIPEDWEPRAKQSRTVALLAALCRALRVAFADFSAAPWQGFEKSERGPNNSSLFLFLPQAVVVVVALG